MNTTIQTQTEDSAVAYAVTCAARHTLAEYRDGCYAVYECAGTYYVRNTKEPKPENARTVCMAQRWDAHTVQVRFSDRSPQWVAR